MRRSNVSISLLVAILFFVTQSSNAFASGASISLATQSGPEFQTGATITANWRIVWNTIASIPTRFCLVVNGQAQWSEEVPANSVLAMDMESSRKPVPEEATVSLVVVTGILIFPPPGEAGPPQLIGAVSHTFSWTQVP